MNGMTAVDIHAHYVVSELLRKKGRPEAWRYERSSDHDGQILLRRGGDRVPCAYEPSDIDRVVENMDVLSLATMALNIAPFQLGYDLEPTTGSEVARIANDSLLSAVARHPGRFVAMGTLPMQDVDSALAELERIMSEDSVAGVQLGSNVNGVYLGSERFRPVWEAIAEWDAAVFVHPVNLIGADRLGDFFLANLIGNPVDTCRSIADVVFSGLLEELPHLRICFAHGGGAAPVLLGRWNHGYKKRPQAKGRLTRTPGESFRLLYFDHIVHSELSLRHLIDMVGADHIMVGSDYPFDMGPDEPVTSLEGAKSLTAAEKQAITRDTAARFLRLDT